MIKVFVLIMIVSYGQGIPSVATQEFSDLKRCEMAKEKFLDLKKAHDATCVEK